jgi:hypothetical protein
MCNSETPINIDVYDEHVTRKTQLKNIKRLTLDNPTIVRQFAGSVGERRVETFIVKERKTEGYEAFKAIARIKRDKVVSSNAPRIVEVLMDPGAELNLIRASVLNANSCNTRRIAVHAREPTNITLLNNGKEIGRVQEAVYLTFALDGANGTQTTYHEWLYVWEGMKEEMILGSLFCREQEFTCFHTRLAPWEECLSHNRPKRVREVEQVSQAIAIPDDEKQPCEHGDIQLLPCPHTNKEARTRDRVFTVPEKIDEHAKKHAEQKTLPTLVVAGKRRKEHHGQVPSIIKKDHSNHMPVTCEKLAHRKVMHILLNQTMQEQKSILNKFQQITSSNVTMTMDEAETLRDTARMCAREAEKAYSNNKHLLGLSKPTLQHAKQERYYLDPFAEAEPGKSAEGTARRFVNGQCVTLQNLVTQSELNNKPARIVDYDEDKSKYVISVSSPLGYWYATEDKLKSIDPLPTKDDYTACGIDMSSGQPTLDPLIKPVHRQYGKQFSPEATEKINELLEKYKHVFGKDISRPCKFKPMKIELIPGAVLPRNPRSWKNSPAQRAEVRAQLQSFIDMGIVRASSTAIVSNVLLVKRPGMPGKFRFTIDFRQLNDATVAAPWQMPEVQSQLDRLAGNSIFGCIDLSSYYHQIELDSGSKFLTGFITEDGVFEYQRVPMGLKNACAHAQSQLQGAIDSDPVLRKYNLRNYFDDLPLAAKSPEEFLIILEAVLKLGDRLDLKFNAEKSIFGVDSITHCGFIVNSKGVQVDPQRIEALREVEAPKSMKGVQSVLGIWNYIRNFIPNFSSRALPLTDLVGTKKKAKAFVWTDKCQAAFDDLKAATLDTSLLFNIDYNKPIFIRCDSSQFGAGAVLFQFDEQGRECPIAYASRKYTIAERNYCTFQQEAAAVVWSLEKFSNFHQGHHVIVQSDHKNLSWIKKTAMPQLTRWRLRLQDFDFSLEYYEGAKNVVADGLSRKNVDDGDIDISMRDFLPEHAAQQSYLQGTVPVRCLNEYSTSRKPTAAERTWEQRITVCASSAEIGGGNTAPQDDHGIAEGETLWTPEAVLDDDNDTYAFDNTLNDHVTANIQPIQADAAPAVRPPIPDIESNSPRAAFDKAHNCTVGHAGLMVTLSRVLRSNRAWATREQMMKDIDQFLSGCVVCQKFRKRHNRRTDERFVIEGNPFAELSVDILKLPKRDCNGNLYVVVVVDSFSRWVSLEAVQDKTALSAARAILRTMGNFGVPLTIRSDGGKEFVNDILASIELILGVEHHKVMPYHHEGNSLAERANRSVLENLRNIIFDKRYILNGQHQWSDLLPLVQRIMNASFNSSIGCSPAMLLFGNNVDLDRCLLTGTPVPLNGQSVPDYIEALSHNQRVALDAARQSLHATHAKNIAKWRTKHKGDSALRTKLQEASLDEEQGIWVLARVRDDAPIEKWQPKWTGPFQFLYFKEGSDSVLCLYDTCSNKVIEAHINDVALWDGHFVNSAEGMASVAETDHWEYPMDGILGIALKPEDDDDHPVALPLDRPRQHSNKHKYLFSVKWHGYPEPSWEPYTTVKDTSVFELFSTAHPILNLTKM